MEKELIKSIDVNRQGVFQYHLTVYKVCEYEISISEYESFAMVNIRKLLDEGKVLDNYFHYLPEMYGDITDLDGNINPKINIQTTSYGALNLDLFSEYIKAMKKAKDVSEYIMKNIIMEVSNKY